MNGRKFLESLAVLRPLLLVTACVYASLIAYYQFYGDFSFAIAGITVKVAGYSNPVIILTLVCLAFIATGGKTDYPSLSPGEKREVSFAALILAVIAVAPITYNGFGAVSFASLLFLILAVGLSLSKQPLLREDGFVSFVARHEKIVMGSLFLLFLALLTFHFGIREYYYDSADQIMYGNGVRAGKFKITHGRLSGGAIENPPMSAYMMGILTAISQNPATLNAITSAFNALAVLAALAYFARELPPLFAVVSAFCLAVSPFTLIYSNVMWEGSLMFPCAIVFHMKLKEFIASNSQKALAIAAIAAVFASQNHQQGFFYFPALMAVFLIYRKNISFKTFIAIGIAALAISAPYMGYVFLEGGLAKIVTYLSTPDKPYGYILNYSAELDALEFKGQMPLYNIGAASAYFFQFLYAMHFGSALGYRGVEVERVIYLLSLMFAGMFMIGWARYIVWAVAGKRFFSVNPEETEHFPLPFQIAGFMVTAVTVSFLMIAKALWFKHYLLLFPSHAIITAWPVWRLWRYSGVRVTFAIGASSSLAATLLFLLTIKSMGCGMYGAIHHYGLTYEKISEIADDARAALKPGESPQLIISGTWVLPLATVVSRDGLKISPYGAQVSISVHQMDDDKFIPAQYVVERLVEEMESRGHVLREAIGLIPPSATVAANDAPNEANLEAVRTFNPYAPLPGTPWMMIKDRPGAKKFIEGRETPDVEYIIVDTNDPRLHIPYPAHHIQRLLIADHYNAIYYKGGVLVLKKGALRTMDDEILFKYFNKFVPSEMSSSTGYLNFYGPSLRKTSLMAKEGVSKKGFLAFGPYINLPAGDYSAIFRVMTDGSRTSDVPMVVDVTSGKGEAILARREIHNENSGRWQEIKLDFSVKETLARDVEFRAYFTGVGEAKFEHVRIFKTPR